MTNDNKNHLKESNDQREHVNPVSSAIYFRTAKNCQPSDQVAMADWNWLTVVSSCDIHCSDVSRALTLYFGFR